MNNLFNILLEKKFSNLSKFKKEFIYLNILYEKILEYNNLKKLELYRNLSIPQLGNVFDKKFLVVYIITISFSRSNTTLHVSDIKGNVKLFYTAGSVNLSGKQKKRRVLAILRLFKLLYRNASFLYGKPISLHLNNVNRHKFLIIRKLKQKFFIKLIKEFNQSPYNGCRKPKIRRKKYKKKLL